MKVTKGQLKRLIKEELRRRLDELHPGSQVGSYMKQGVVKLWEADNMIQKALAEAETEQETKVIKAMHDQVERLAFDIDSKSQSIISGDVNKQRRTPAALPKPKRRQSMD